MKKIILVIVVFNFVIFPQTKPKDNLSEIKSQIISYYESEKINKDYQKAIDAKMNELKKAIKQNSQNKMAAVVFDIDETILSNYPGMKEMDFGYISKLWDEWIKKGIAPVIEPTKKLYEYLVQKNIKVIFISGRYNDQYEITKQNFYNVGITKFDTIITKVRGKSYPTAGKFKEEIREELVKKGYTIIACVGDQWSDMEGKHTGIKIKLPNYTRAKEWKIPRKFSHIYTPILNENNYGKILKHISKAIPQLRANEIRKIASWFLKEKKAGAKIFKTSRSLYQELQVVKDTEIQQCSSKLKNLKIKGDQI